jgi:hypothetical protein
VFLKNYSNCFLVGDVYYVDEPDFVIEEEFVFDKSMTLLMEDLSCSKTGWYGYTQ